MSKRIRYLFEYMVFMVFLGAFRVLPYRVASFFGGFIVENLGFFLKANKVAKQNLDFVFPDMDGSKKRKILAGVWNNLGRNFAEYPHIVSFSDKKYYSLVDVIGEEKIQKFIEEKKSLIFISAHFSNWDIMYKYFAIRNIKTNMIFRAANNPLINKVVVGMKNMKNFKMYEKGLAGAGKAVRGVLKGEVLATFIDQKLSEGIDVPFFGKNVKTPPLAGNLALKYDIPLVPVHVERDGGRFKLIIEDLIYTKDKKFTDDISVMTELNKRIEEWIKNKPEEWFWVHNRWKK